jgi:hypothetical protein
MLGIGELIFRSDDTRLTALQFAFRLLQPRAEPCRRVFGACARFARRGARRGRGAKLEGLQSKHAWLIHDAIDPPLQFSKSRKIVFQPGKSLFDDAETFVATREGSAAGRGAFAIVGLFDKKYC